MREFCFTLSKDKKPQYLKIAGAFRDAIRKGQLRPGDLLPSTRSIAESARVHRHTVMSALHELVAEGWIVAKPRCAYRVSETLPPLFFEAHIRRVSAHRRNRHAWTFARTPKVLPLRELHHLKFNFTSGTPDLRLFPHAEFQACVNESIRRSGQKLMEYGNVEGHGPFIEELKTYLRRMRALSGRDLLVTHGSQEAIFLIGQLFLGSGDRVIVEELGYPPAFEALRASGAELVPARVDQAGVDPDHVETLLRKGRVKLLYLTPLHQYPTTVKLALARRMHLYELACRYAVPILEDDYDHEYHYRCQPLAPLASDDPAGLILYVSTFSKVFSPSARLGFIVGQSEFIGHLAYLKKLVSRQNDLLTQDALARWMRSGGLERHLRRTRRSYEERRNTMITSLEAARLRGAEVSWEVPDGGMAMWVKTLCDSAGIAERAKAAEVAVGPEEKFRVRYAKGSGLRLAFARHNPREIQQGMERLWRFL